MDLFNDLVDFLRKIGDYYIEVEGNTASLSNFIIGFNRKTNQKISLNTDGICDLKDANKWGLEFRVYTNERPAPLLGNKFHNNTNIRHREYRYRISDNDLIEQLLYSGFGLGKNRGDL